MGLATFAMHQQVVLPTNAVTCQLSQVVEALRLLERVDGLLGSPTTWNEALKLLDEPLIATRLGPALDACTEQPTTKDNLMCAQPERAQPGCLRPDVA